MIQRQSYMLWKNAKHSVVSQIVSLSVPLALFNLGYLLNIQTLFPSEERHFVKVFFNKKCFYITDDDIFRIFLRTF